MRCSTQFRYIHLCSISGADPTIENRASQNPFSVAKKHKNKVYTESSRVCGIFLSDELKIDDRNVQSF